MKPKYRALYWTAFILSRIVYAPLIIVELARIRYYKAKVAKQIGPDATAFERGYASAPYMVRQMGRQGVIDYIAYRYHRGEADEFLNGVARWLNEHPVQRP